MQRRRPRARAVSQRIYAAIEAEHAQHERRDTAKLLGSATVNEIVERTVPVPMDPIEQARAVGAALRGATV